MRLFLPLLAAVMLSSEALGGDLDLESDGDGEMFELEEDRLRGLGPTERAAAVRAIIARRRIEDFPELCRIVEQNKDLKETQEAATEVLRSFGGARLVPVGTRVLRNSIPAYQQRLGARLLGASGDPKNAAPVLVEAARSGEHSEEVQAEIAHALGTLGAPAAAPVLRRWAGRGAIGQIDLLGMFARAALCAAGDFSFMDRCLDDCDTMIRARAALAHDIRVMAPYRTQGELNLMKAAHKQYSEYVLLFESVFAAGIDSERVAGVVKRLRSTPDSPLANMVYSLLGKAVRRRNAATLLPLLDCPHPEIQEESARLAIDTGDARIAGQVLAALRAKLDSPSFMDRALVVRLAGLFGPEERVTILAGGMADASAFVVAEALASALSVSSVELARAASRVRDDEKWRASGRIRALADEVVRLSSRAAMR